MATSIAAFGSLSRQVWSRLLIAGVLSLLLHIALLLGVPFTPVAGVPDGISILSARLEAAADTAPAQNLAPSATEERPSPIPEFAPAKPAAIGTKARDKRKLASELPPAAGGGVELPLISDPTYYPARQLDVYPRPLTPLKIDFPATATNARADGRLLVLLLIDEFGVVNEASIVEAEPQGYFEEATLDVFRAARFSPAQKAGKPVKSRALLQVNYIYGDNRAVVR